MTQAHSVEGLSQLNAALSQKTAPEPADYQAAQELILKLPSLKSTLSPAAGALLDNVVAVSSTAKKGGHSSGQIYLHFTFKLVAVKSI
jgi:hypothetical protein